MCDAGRVAAWAGDCGERQIAAATPASVGAAAAAVAACGIRMRDGLLWAPKGLLPAEGALSGKVRGVPARF